MIYIDWIRNKLIVIFKFSFHRGFSHNRSSSCKTFFFLFKDYNNASVLTIFISFFRLEDIPGEDAEIFKQYTKEELEGSDVDQYKHELNLLEENLSAKRPDLKAIEEFKRKEAVYLEVRFQYLHLLCFVSINCLNNDWVPTRDKSALGQIIATFTYRISS